MEKVANTDQNDSETSSVWIAIIGVAKLAANKMAETTQIKTINEKVIMPGIAINKILNGVMSKKRKKTVRAILSAGDFVMVMALYSD